MPTRFGTRDCLNRENECSSVVMSLEQQGTRKMQYWAITIKKSKGYRFDKRDLTLLSSFGELWT